MPITTRAPIKSLGDLLEAIKEVRTLWASGNPVLEELWFRGERSTSHKLLPSLYRRPSVRGGFHKKEMSLLHDFRLRARGHVSRRSDLHRSPWEWYAAARHHGLPSRLLDWTGSVLIALFFAIERHWEKCDKGVWGQNRDKRSSRYTGKQQPCVWVLEAGSLNLKSQNLDYIIALDSKEAFLNSYYPDRTTGCVTKSSTNRWPVALYPPRMHERISSQHGYFTLHGHDPSPLESLAQMPGQPPLRLAQIPIATGSIPSLIDDLVLSGITHASIYADLDAVAKSVRWSYMEGGTLDG